MNRPTKRDRFWAAEGFKRGYQRGHDDTVYAAKSVGESVCLEDPVCCDEWLDTENQVGATFAGALAEMAPKPAPAECLELEENIRAFKREIRIMQESLEQKNKALAGLRYVWCSGGCPGGVDGDVTEEIVQAAEANTRRLRQWFDNHQARKQGEEQKTRIDFYDIEPEASEVKAK